MRAASPVSPSLQPARTARVARHLIAACAIALLATGTARSAPEAPLREHAIPSCYDELPGHAPAPATRALTVVIDQTTFTDPRLRRIVHETVARLLRPGMRVSVATFSAFAQGRYLDVVTAGRIESPVTGRARDAVPKRQLLRSDECLGDQFVFARRLVARAIDDAFSGSDPRLAQSDILAALHDLGRRVGAEGDGERLVVLVSDMLENSSVTSFYAGNRLRRIEPVEELRRADAAGLRPDFHGARVVVIGAGAVSDRAADASSYRDPRALLALEAFWRSWLAAAGADLVEFGKPTPLVEVRWNAASGTP
jgi:hypothetical protein